MKQVVEDTKTFLKTLRDDEYVFPIAVLIDGQLFRACIWDAGIATEQLPQLTMIFLNELQQFDSLLDDKFKRTGS
jgi:hypothetical protein